MARAWHTCGADSTWAVSSSTGQSEYVVDPSLDDVLQFDFSQGNCLIKKREREGERDRGKERDRGRERKIDFHRNLTESVISTYYWRHPRWNLNLFIVWEATNREQPQEYSEGRRASKRLRNCLKCTQEHKGKCVHHLGNDGNFNREI